MKKKSFPTGAAIILAIAVLTVVSLFSALASSAAMQPQNVLLKQGETTEFSRITIQLVSATADGQQVLVKAGVQTAILSENSEATLSGLAIRFNGMTNQSQANLSISALEQAAQAINETQAQEIFAQLFPQYPASSITVVDAGNYWAVSGYRKYSTTANASASINGAPIPSYSFTDGAIILVNKATGEVQNAWKTN